jgi:hypothetical protein
MYNLQTHLLECYFSAWDYLQSHPKVAEWRRSTGDDLAFTDAAVSTIALMTRLLPYRYVGHRPMKLVAVNSEKAFPNHASYKQWIRRLQRLPD